MALGFGKDDIFRNSYNLMSEVLEEENLFIVDGQHDWETWHNVLMCLLQSNKWQGEDGGLLQSVDTFQIIDEGKNTEAKINPENDKNGTCSIFNNVKINERRITMDERMKALIAIGASVTANCQPCIEYHLNKALELGIEKVEIAQAVDVAKGVRKGAANSMDKHAFNLIQESQDRAAIPERRHAVVVHSSNNPGTHYLLPRRLCRNSFYGTIFTCSLTTEY